MNYGISILFRAIPLAMAAFCFAYGAYVFAAGDDPSRLTAGPVLFFLGSICVALYCTAATIIRQIIGTYIELLRDSRFVILVLVAALGMSGLFAYISAAPFVLQGHYGLDQQAFELVFAAGAIALIGATQFNVVLLRRFSPQAITVAALSWSALAGAVFVTLTVAGVGGLSAFVAPVLAILAGMGLVLPNAPAVALSRHPEAAGTAAALLGAAQFGLGAAVAPAIGALGNGALALSWVMTAGMAIALAALLLVGRRNGDDDPDEYPGDSFDAAPEVVAEPA